MASATLIKLKRRTRRKAGLRKRIIGTTERPRMSVFRSLNHIYVQVIDDSNGRTLVSASDREKASAAAKGKVTSAKNIGKVVAERAAKAGVTKVVFDRNGYLFHGRVKALAEGAREGGLQF
ncbi:MAG: 50S ribosomal protein L18 [Planctomycetes bacterium]|nr:50S ribosomal protein L18 [Planctomycetota bacterium]